MINDDDDYKEAFVNFAVLMAIVSCCPEEFQHAIA